MADETMNVLKRTKPDLYQTKVNKIATFIKDQGGHAKIYGRGRWFCKYD